MRERRTTQKNGRRTEGAVGRPDKHRATVDSNTLEEQCHPRKIFIGGLAHKTTTQHLRDHFGRFGAIVDAVVLRWPDGRSRGFGYVTFADAQAAHCTLQQAHQLSGREVDVKRAVPGTNKLFVGGLPQNTSANELREHFEKFGVVSDAVVMIDPATSRSRGFGFVCFLPGQEGAAAVTASLDDYDNHRIRGKWIEVKSAAPPHKLVPSSNGSKTGSVSPSVQEDVKLDNECDFDGIPTAALQSGGRLMSMPHRENENTQPNQQQGPEKPQQLGSPVKVALPTATVRQPLHSPPPPPERLQSQVPPGPLHSPPPGLGAIYAQDYAAGTAAVPPWQAHNPWWSGPAVRQPPWGLGGTSMPPHAHLFGTAANASQGLLHSGSGTTMCTGNGSGDELGDSGASSLVGEDGLSAAESLQRNLEQLLRRSLQSKVEAGACQGAPMYAPTCSTSTQAAVAALPVAADSA